MKKFLRTLMLMALMLVPLALRAQGTDCSTAVTVTSTTPFFEGFEGGSMPACWTQDGSSSTWSVGVGDNSTSTGSATGNGNAKITHGTTGSTVKLITPVLDLSEFTTAQLNFSQVRRSWSGDIDGLNVYYRTSSTDTWHLLQEYTAACATWTETEITLTTVSATFQIAFEFDDAYGYGCGIDDVRIDAAPTCFKVTNLAIDATATTTSSLTLTWTDALNTGATYTVYDMSDTSVVQSGITATTYTVSNLTANTVYSYAVMTDCGDGDVTELTTPVSGRTACGAVVAPYTWDFEDMSTGAAPLCWTKLTGGSANVTSGTSTDNYHSASNYIQFSGVAGNNVLVLPETEDEISTLRLRFWTRPESVTNSSCGTFSVGYITDISDASTFVAVETYTYSDFTAYEEKSAFFVNAPMDARMAMRHDATSSSWYWRVDDVTIEEAPSCMPVISLAVDTVTSNSVTLTWVSDDNSFIVYNMADSSQVATSNTTSCTINGLTANTAYTFGVAVNCSGNEISDTVRISTRTACGAIDTLPYTWSFETAEQNSTMGSYKLPWCWQRINDATSSSYNYYPYCYSNSSNAHTGSYSLYFYMNSSTSYADAPMAVLPELNITANPMNLNRLTFWAKSSSSTATNTVMVYTMSDPDDQSTYTLIGSETVTNTYAKYAFNMANAGSTHSYVAIVVPKDESTSFYMYIDDVTLEVAPSCVELARVNVDTAYAHSVTLSWTDDNNAGATYSVYLIDENDSVILVENNIDANTFTVEDLTPAHTYTFAVEVNCGSGNSQLTTATATTACATLTIDEENSFFENFNSGLTTGIPNCWDNSEGTTTSASYKWNYTYTANKAYDSTYLMFNSYMNSTGLTNFLATPEFELTVPARLRFMYKNPTGGDLSVLVGTPGSSQRTTLASGLTGANNWTEKTILLPESFVGDTVVFYFKATSNYGSGDAYIYLDNVKVDAQPSCLPVSNVVVSNVTNNSAVISWIGNGDSNATYSIYNGEEAMETDIDGTTVTLTGLDDNTLYTLSVVPSCSGEPGEAVTFSFHTLCDAIDLPLTESFETTSATVACWTFDGNSALNNGNMGIATVSGHKVMKFQATTYDASATGNYLQYGYSPLFNASSSATALRVRVRYSTYYSSYSTYVTLKFGYILADGTEIWEEGTHTTSGPTAYQYYIDTIPATAVQVAVRYRSTSYSTSYVAYIDSVMIEELEDELCFPVANLSVDSVSSESVTLSWVSDGASFTVVNMGDGEVAGTVQENTITIEDLEADSSYTFGVVVNCTSTSSDTVTITFRTECDAIVVDEENPFTEGFEDTAFPPNCWSTRHIAGPGTYVWQRATDRSHASTASAKLPDMNATTYTDLVTPRLTINGEDNYQVSFWMYRISGTKPNEGVKVWVNNRPDTTGGIALMHIRRAFQMGDITETAEGWYQYSAIIPNTMNEGFYVIFQGISEYGNYSNIDDILIEKAPDCLPVTNLSVDSVSSESVTLKWVSDVENFSIINMADSQIVGTTQDTVYTIGDLAADSSYTFGVVVNCDNSSSDTVTISVRTACEAYAMPFTENFNTLTAGIPSCWDNSEGTTTTASYRWNYYATGHEGVGLRFNSYTNSNNNTNILVTPAITISEAAQLSFWYKNPTGGDFTVMISTDGTNFDTLATDLTGVSNWTEFEAIIGADYVGETVNIYFKGTSNYGNGDAYIYLDDVMVDVAPSCLPVTDIAIDTFAANSVTVAWNGNAASYSLYIIDNTDTTFVTTVTDAFYTFTGLTASTGYTFGVRAVCSDQDSASLVTIDASTDCEGGSCNIQFVMSDSYGDGWNGNAISVIQNSAVLGTYTIPSGNSSASYDVQVCRGTPVQLSWTAGSFAYETSFEVFDGAGQQVYACTDGSNLSAGVFYTIENACPTCFPVTDLAVDTIGEDLVTIYWNGNADNYNVYNDALLVATTTDTFYTFTGLSASVTYTFGVRSVCADDDSSLMRTIVARTSCGILNNLPYVTGFEAADLVSTTAATALPYCWTRNTSIATSTIPYSYSGNAHSGSRALYFSGSTAITAPDTMMVVMPAVDVTAYPMSGNRLVFWAKMGSATASKTLYVGTMTDPADRSTFAVVDSVALDTNAYTKVRMPLTAATSSYVALMAKKGAGDIYVDDLTLEVTPACAAEITSLEVDSLTSTSVSLHWSVYEGANVTYSVYNGTTLVQANIANTSFTITNLTPSTEYIFKVEPNCSATAAGASMSISVATACGAVTEFPYEQTFETEPLCWTAIDADGDGYNWYVYSGAIQSASYASGALTPDNWLISPQFELPTTGSYEVTWTAMAQDQSWPAEHYGVYVSATGTNTSDFTLIQEWTLGTGAFSPVIDLSSYAGQNIYIALRHFNCTDQFRLSIDDFIVREQPGANQVVITVQQNNPAYGTVSGGGVYTIGDSVTVTATPASSYVFNRWINENGVSVSNDNPYTFAAATDLTLKAIFISSSATTYTITVEVNDSTMGTATGGGSYASGDDATLVATANPGYLFVNWTQVSSFGENIVSTNATFTASVTSDKTFRANFEVDTTPVTPHYTVSASSANATMGSASVTPSGEVEEGTSVTFTASANNGYHFVKWTNASGAVVSTANPYTTTVTTDLALTANFEANDPGTTYYTVSVSSSNNAQGTVSSTHSGQVAAGTSVTVTATAAHGFSFAAWKDANGTTVSTDNPYTFTVNADVTLVANFSQVGIDQVEMTSVNLYPNPASTMVTIDGIEGKAQVTVVDMNGRVSGEWNVMNGKLTIDVSGLAKGAYFVRIVGEQNSAIRKLVVK